MSRFFNGGDSSDNSHHMSYSDNFSTSSTGATNPVGPAYQVGEDSKKIPAAGGGGLLRHSSSPAGFFSNLLVDNNGTSGIAVGLVFARKHKKAA